MKLIFITGITRGLGAALLDQLLLIDNLFIVGLSKNNVSKKYLGKKKFLFIKVDLSDIKYLIKNISDQIRNGVSNISEVIFINNAGIISPIGDIHQLDEQDIIDNVNINFTAPTLIINFLKKKWGNLKIINISSGAAIRPIAGWGMYCSTKSAMKMFCDVINANHKNIVLNIDPGVMDTNMQVVIRSSSKNVFPMVGDFLEMKENATLKSPHQVAVEVIVKMKNAKFL